MTPEQWIQLLDVLFRGIAIVCVPLATIYIMIGAARAKKNGESIKILEKNTNSMSERNEAIAKKLGVDEGIKQERASVLAHAVVTPPQVMIPQPAVMQQPAVPARNAPLPVRDDRTADAVKEGTAAAQKTADAAVETAAAATISAEANVRLADLAEAAAKKTDG